MIGLLLNSIYLIVDGIFIGNCLGRDAMAAVVSVPFIEVLIALSMAVASGAGIIISSQLGQKENEKAIQTFNTAILCSANIGIAAIILGNIFLHPLAEILGSTPQIHDKAINYLW